MKVRCSIFPYTRNNQWHLLVDLCRQCYGSWQVEGEAICKSNERWAIRCFLHNDWHQYLSVTDFRYVIDSIITLCINSQLTLSIWPKTGFFLNLVFNWILKNFKLINYILYLVVNMLLENILIFSDIDIAMIAMKFGTHLPLGS